MMGSNSSEPGHIANEGPRNRVTISTPIAVAKYEVTESQFQEYLRRAGAGRSGTCDVYENGGWSQKNPGLYSSYLPGRNEPATCLTWNEAKAYANWLSEQTGQRYRLPTEEEWEYIARAGAQTAYSFGVDASEGCQFMNGADISARQQNRELIGVACDDGHAGLAPVGNFLPNRFGLHDVHGNAWEWTADAWTSSHAPGARTGSTRVIRGGSAYSDPAGLRSANRYFQAPNSGRVDIGFRLVRDLSPN